YESFHRSATAPQACAAANFGASRPDFRSHAGCGGITVDSPETFAGQTAGCLMVNVENENVRLLRAADTLGLDLTDDQVQAMLGYVRELSKWNRTYNLTAIRQTDQMLVQHVFDSMAIIPN